MRVKGFLGTALWPLATSLATQRLIGKDQGLVLTFHYIGPPVLRGVGDDLFMPLTEFRRVLDFIAARLRPLAPAEFLRRMREGALPERATMITFDDCLRETCAKALPELSKRGLAAAFFCCPGLVAADRTVPSLELMWICATARPGAYRARGAEVRIGEHASRIAAYQRLWPDLLRCPSRQHSAFLAQLREEFGIRGAKPRSLQVANWNLLASLDAGGMLVGNHTMLHSTVTADGLPQFEDDVALAFNLIEWRLGERPRVFCYPYGRKADQAGTEEALQKTGAEFAFVTQGGIASPRRSGLLNLHREDASYSASATKLAPLLALVR